jgi:hypothetical protein
MANFKDAIEEMMVTKLSFLERTAMAKALEVGEQYGYGNTIAWLMTQWACKLRDETGLSEETAIAATRVDPYRLPEQQNIYVKASDGQLIKQDNSDNDSDDILQQDIVVRLKNIEFVLNRLAQYITRNH